MESESRFKILFEKLAESTIAVAESDGAKEATEQELDEIDELRRLSASIAQPRPTHFTTT